MDIPALVRGMSDLLQRSLGPSGLDVAVPRLAKPFRQKDLRSAIAGAVSAR